MTQRTPLVLLCCEEMSITPTSIRTSSPCHVRTKFGNRNEFYYNRNEFYYICVPYFVRFRCSLECHLGLDMRISNPYIEDDTFQTHICAKDEKIHYKHNNKMKIKDIIIVSFLALPILAHGDESVQQIISRAESGNADAQFQLGTMYIDGDVVKKDTATAAKWFLKAANQEVLAAQYYMGYAYRDGVGVPQNYKESAKWFRKAAEKGLSDAQYELGCLYIDGNGVPQNFVLAARWFERAAKQGHVDSQFLLGSMYAEGKGVPQNLAEATKWLKEAAKQGDEEALKLLKKIGN